MARCVGIQRDIRLSNLESYANYYYLNFRGYTGLHGDCYDRFLIRMNEMAESTSIINQVVNNISYSDTKKKENNTNDSNILPHVLLNNLYKNNYFKTQLHNEKTIMEEVINDFKK
jgi:NADH:ubiquinone oxidoreductase subunit D